MLARTPLVALAATLLVTSAAMATTVLALSLPEMTHASQLIVRAEVAAVTPVDLRREGRGIFTDVEFNVLETLKGDVGERFVMRLVGGRAADGLTYLIPGMPSFQAGEEVVLFLETTSLGHIPTGLGQGVFRVTGAGEHATAKSSMNGANVVRRGDRGELHAVEDDAVTRSLSSLRADVLSLVKAPSAQTPTRR